MNKIEIKRMKDKGERHYTDKNDLFNLPMKLLVIGRSQLSGKTNFICSILLDDDPRLYGDDFKGEIRVRIKAVLYRSADWDGDGDDEKPPGWLPDDGGVG